MTAIIGFDLVDKSIIITDKRIIGGNSLKTITEPKYIIKNNLIISVTGDMKIRHLLKYRWNNENTIFNNGFDVMESIQEFAKEYDKKFETDIFSSFGMLISINGALVEFNQEFSIISPRKNIYSLGCAWEYIMGILDSKTNNCDINCLSENKINDIVKETLLLASNFTYGVSKEYDIISQPKS